MNSSDSAIWLQPGPQATFFARPGPLASPVETLDLGLAILSMVVSGSLFKGGIGSI